MSPQQVTVDCSSKIVKRYTDAYRYAQVFVWAGMLVKMVAVVVGFLILAAGAAVASNVGPLQNTFFRMSGGVPPPFAEYIVFAGLLVVLVGVAIGALIWFFGTIIAAQGQFLRASVDACVNTSPFLTDAQRAQAMSLT